MTTLAFGPYITNLAQDMCPITLTNFEDIPPSSLCTLTGASCGHSYDRTALEQYVSRNRHRNGHLFDSLQCPMCKKQYGVKIGDVCFAGATMDIVAVQERLDTTVPHEGTWVIKYSFPSGKHNDVVYKSERRIAYYPINHEGSKIVALLCVAWQRNLLFTLGESLSRGTSNSIIWGQVHQKTSRSGGQTAHGYPDPTYHQRMLVEFQACGVDTYPTFQ